MVLTEKLSHSKVITFYSFFSSVGSILILEGGCSAIEGRLQFHFRSFSAIPYITSWRRPISVCLVLVYEQLLFDTRLHLIYLHCLSRCRASIITLLPFKTPFVSSVLCFPSLPESSLDKSLHSSVYRAEKSPPFS